MLLTLAMTVVFGLRKNFVLLVITVVFRRFGGLKNCPTTLLGFQVTYHHSVRCGGQGCLLYDCFIFLNLTKAKYLFKKQVYSLLYGEI